MKILVLGTYRENSGYGQAARQYLNSLLTTDCEVACRPLHFSHAFSPVSEAVEEAEKRLIPDPDFVWQICPPYQYEKLPAPSIGTFYLETTPITPGWSQSASLVDGLILSSTAMVDWCQELPEFQHRQIPVVPVPVNLNAATVPQPKNHLMKKTKNVRQFYCFDDGSKRKNLEGIIRAYFLAFNPDEPVELLVKTNRSEASQRQFMADIISKLGSNYLPCIQFLPGKWSESEILALHQSADCYVSLSYGEGWGIPAQDAMVCGKPVICPASGGYLDLVDESRGWLVPVQKTPCYDGGPVHRRLFTGKQCWYSPDINRAAEYMREAMDATLLSKKSDACYNYVPIFGTSVVGQRLKEIFHEKAKRLKTH